METPKKGDEAETTLPVLTPKVAGGSQRVIKQIMVIDPNKLRLAGLDVKMAEALKKAKKKTQPKAKESKLAAAKSILNKKLKEALSKKDAAPAPASPQTPVKNVKSVDEAAAAPKLSPSDKKQAGKAKPKICVATLKSLMPPPSFPVSSLISPTQTVEIKVLKSQKTKQSIEVKIVDASVEKPQKIDVFPKASLKPQTVPKTEVTKPEVKVKCYERKKSNISQSKDQPKEISAPVSQPEETTTQTVIVHIESNTKSTEEPTKEPPKKSNLELDSVPKKTAINVVQGLKNTKHIESNNKKTETPRKESTKEKDASESDLHKTVTNVTEAVTNTKQKEATKKTEKPRKVSHKEKDASESDLQETQSNAGEPLKNTPVQIVTSKPPPKEDKSLKETIIEVIPSEEESLVPELEISTNMVSVSPIPLKSLPVTPDTSLKIVSSSTPIRQKSLPKVIESKVLSPGEKIDLSILTQKTPTALTIPKKRYKLDQNWISSESNQAESIYINMSQVVVEPSPPPRDVEDQHQESAVDFINNLSLFFAESPKNKSLNKSVPDILTKECSEDATSFLVSLFQQKQEASPKMTTQTKPSSQENQGSKAVAVKSPSQDEKKIPVKKETSSKNVVETSKNQVLDLDESKSQNEERSAHKNEQLVVKTLHETTLDASKSLSRLHKEEQTIQESKSISKTEIDKPPKGSIETNSCPAKTDLNSTLRSTEDEEKELPSVPISVSSKTSSLPKSSIESVQKPINKPSTPPVSTRRKGSKPIPVLIPKLKKSRKPPTPAEKPPEERIIEKPSEKPQEESPTQPVSTKERLTDSITNESTPCTTKDDIKKLPEESADQSSVPSASKDSDEILNELPTSSKTERPQRQRKMSLKLIESSESRSGIKSPPLQGSVDKTVEQAPISIERPQRQRKVSFKLLDSADSTVKASSVQETNPADIEVATKAERPQRQRRLTAKLLESSESLPSIKSIPQVNSQCVEHEAKDKMQLDTATGTETGKGTETDTDTTQCPKIDSDPTNTDDLIAIEVEKNVLKDPISQLDAFHESVEKFELACGTEKSQELEAATPSLEGEGASLSEYPFYDAICSEISNSSENVQPTVGKENVSSEKTSTTKILRRRKESLRSRKFGGDQISIVSNDSSDIPAHTTSDLQNVPLTKSTRKRKETPIICEPKKEGEEEFTPKPSETKFHARNLVSEMVQSEETFSPEPKEILNNSAVMENSTNIDTPTNTKGRKRRGRPPKLKKPFPQQEVMEAVDEVTQPTIEEKSKEMPSSSIDQHSQDVSDVKLLEDAAEVSTARTTEDDTIQPSTTVLRKNSNFGGSWETLPSADENIDIIAPEKDSSKNAKKKTRKSRITSNSLKSKGNEETPESSKDKVEKPEKFSLNTSKSKDEEEMPDSKDKVDTPENVPSNTPHSKSQKRKMPGIQEKVPLSAKDPPTNIQTLTEGIIQASVSTKEGDMTLSKNVDDAILNPGENETIKSTEPITESPQKNPNEDTGSIKFPIEESQSRPDKGLQVKEQEIISMSSEHLKSSEIRPDAQNECQFSEGQKTSIVDSCSHPEFVETPQTIDIGQKVHTESSQITKKPSMPIDSLFDDLKSPTTRSEAAKSSKDNKKSLKTIEEPIKIVPPFEDLMFDLDHIESPSFSPICESSRTSNDMDGFEEFDDDLTSAIINTVTEAENAAATSKEELEKTLNSSVDSEKSPHDTILADTQSENVKECSSNSVEKSIAVKESSSDPSSVPSLDLGSKPLTDNELIVEQNEPSPSVLPKNYTEEEKQIEQSSTSKKDKGSSEQSPSVLSKKFTEEEKQNQQSSTPEKDKESFADKEKEIPENSEISDEVLPHSALNSNNLKNKAATHSKPTEELPEAKIKPSSALYSAVLNKSGDIEKEPSKNKAKNPFKKKVPKDGAIGSEPRSEFLGFNEEEIEEGQQWTSLRLSQSEDMESQNIIESPAVSKVKPKHNIKESFKESQSGSAKKQKPEKQKWEKNSAKSLKNWLSKPAKSGSRDDVCDKEEDAKESTASVPPKKRRSRVKDLSESAPVEKDKEHVEEQVPDAEISTTETNVSVIDKSINASDKKEKPKRGRKPKLKNPPIVEQTLQENLPSSTEDINPGHRKSIIIAKTSLEDTPKKLEAVNENDFKTPKRGRKPKGTNQSVGLEKEPIENTPTASKKRKRSVSQENTLATPETPATAEPPAKIAHLDEDMMLVKRRPGRPRKYALDESANVPVVPKTQKEKKYKDDYEFNPRLLLIRKKEELKSNEPLVDPSLQTEPIGPDDVQCALCMGYTPKKKWIQHVSTHYGIGWVVGRPPPLNINSRGSILSFLLEFYKISKVKGLNCRLCNSLRRSALGLLMHLEQCCLTEAEINESRIVCEYCKRNYTKSSYLTHKRSCSDYLKQVLEEAKVENAEVPEGTTADDVLSNTGRLKRKAVIMAETKLKKLDEAPEFVPDDLIKHIPSKNIRSIKSIKESWIMEINSFGKGFCASKTCRFTATAIDDLIDHYQEEVCPYFEKAGYFCVRCKFYNENIEVVRSHVVDKHTPRAPKDKGDSDAEFDSSDSSESIGTDDDDDGNESGSGHEDGDKDGDGERKAKRSKKKKSKAKRRGFQSKHPPTKEYKKLVPDRCSISNIQDIVSRFYDIFIETNYSLEPLFTFAKANYVHMEASELYFPRSTDSMKFTYNRFNGFVKTLGETKVEADQWKQLERLHGMSENGEYIVYLGGPVKNIAWVPLDPHPPSNTQYLAVTVRKGLDKFTRFSNQKRSRSLIFIFKFDISLPPATTTEIKAEIIYAIAIDEGPIHALEFLPSGGYSPEMNRLGMLAVGTIETEIKIYSLPLKVDKNDCDLFPIVKLESSMELHLEVLDNSTDSAEMYNSQCTCIIWSQNAGHNIIVASFLNGFVGIWDISDDPGNLNRFDSNKGKLFTPVSFFWTVEDRLMHMALHYDMNGPRWLAASNSTRKLLIYDLRDITQPMLLRVEVTINIINCIHWPVAWENVMFGLGDTMPSNGCVISVLSPMYIMFAIRRFEKFCTGVSDIHFNIWRNCFAAGADNGDVQVTPLREAVLDVSQRLKIDEKNISTLDIVQLNGEKISQNGIHIPADGMRVFDKDFKDHYGIVFGPTRKIKGCNKPEYYNTKRVPPLNLHRLMRISKIRFNQNKNACDVLAVGYENGLLRVSLHDSHY
ncbi:titin isoform X2 [Eupeodes corollae]|uniref:titin isoform X2 n=1 Tax=Eupeodes corollae TaxID=290404 RepID=UPI00249230AA|nr:titin isoform X2 [Eupeodes corollae]